MINSKTFFFAGGGTGGHIYPAVAVAEQLLKVQPDSEIHFFCSKRSIDSQILEKSGFKFTALDAVGFSLRPAGLIGFCKAFIKSYKTAKEIILNSRNPVVIGAGGFAAAPVCLAAHRNKIPVELLNVDIIPGRANKVISRWADNIYVQFEDTKQYLSKAKGRVHVVGCPVRSSFENPQPVRIKSTLGLAENKKILLVTGASSGAQNINQAVCSLIAKFDSFADSWQIVHLAGRANYEQVKKSYAAAKIENKVLGYCDEMADLLSAADLVIGRSGAVSVAEYAATELASICMPYPYHKDRHQYLNAGKLVEVGAAIIVDDLPDAVERSEWLWEELEPLLKDDSKLIEMSRACKDVAHKDAAVKIAEQLIL